MTDTADPASAGTLAPRVLPLTDGRIVATLETVPALPVNRLSGTWPDAPVHPAWDGLAAVSPSTGAHRPARPAPVPGRPCQCTALPTSLLCADALVAAVDRVDGPGRRHVRRTVDPLALHWDEDDLGHLARGRLYPAHHLHRVYSPPRFALAVAFTPAGRSVLTNLGAPDLPAPGQCAASFASAHAWLADVDLGWLSQPPRRVTCWACTSRCCRSTSTGPSTPPTPLPAPSTAG